MKCSFCSSELEKGRGTMLVQLDGSTMLFCSTKCRHNWKLRSPRKVRWTDIYHKEVKPKNKPKAKKPKPKVEAKPVKKAEKPKKAAKAKPKAKKAKPKAKKK